MEIFLGLPAEAFENKNSPASALHPPYGKHRSCHLAAKRRWSKQASQPGGARLGARNREAGAAREYFLVRRVRGGARLPAGRSLPARGTDPAQPGEKSRLLSASF